MGGLSRIKIWPLVMAFLAVGLAASFIHTRNLKVQAIDLGDAPDVVPPRAGFLELKAIPASQFQSSYYGVFPKGDNRVYSYRPLVGPGWAPNRPVHYFLYETSRTRTFESAWRGRSPSMEVRAADSYDADRMAHDFDRTELQEVHAKVGGRLPTIVLQDFSAKGFTVAPDYVVVEHVDISHHEVSIFDRYEDFLVPALIIVGLPVALVVGGAPFWIYFSLRRKFGRNDKP